MDSLRAIIRNVLLAEAKLLPHFVDRVKERLYDPERITPAFNTKNVDEALSLLEKVNFPGQSNVAVNIFRSGTVYTAYVSDKAVPTKGNNIWVIVRGNELENVVFTSDNAVPQNTQYQMTIGRIRSIVNSRGSYDLSYEDLENRTRMTATRKRGLEMDLPMVTIRGQKWYADTSNQRFIYAKNINKVLTFDDAFNTLPEEELDSILSQLPATA